MNNTFTVAGVSRKGTLKVRHTNDSVVGRTKKMIKDGQTDIKLINMPEPLSKLECVQYLLEHEDFKEEAIQTLLKEYIATAV